MAFRFSGKKDDLILALAIGPKGLSFSLPECVFMGMFMITKHISDPNTQGARKRPAALMREGGAQTGTLV